MMQMRSVILQQAEQIRHSLEVNKDVRVEGQFDWIILAGMGGSGHPGDLLAELQLTTVPLTVHRSYNLPRTYGKKPLVVPSSYSGNTEEALSAYRAANKEGTPILVNTSGGTLEKWAQRDGAPIAKIDYPGMQPRHTLFASFVGLATALKNSGLAEDITEDVLRVADRLEETIPQLESPAKDLAAMLKGKIPVYTSSDTLAFAAKNFKIQHNENAKAPAFWNFFPELNHNEMVGFSNLAAGSAGQAQFHVVMLRDDDDHPRTRARMDVTAELYQKWGVTVSDFSVRGETLLEKMFYAVIFGLWTTYYVAVGYGTDPVPVEGVEDFKAKLKEVAGDV